VQKHQKGVLGMKMTMGETVGHGVPTWWDVRREVVEDKV